MIPARKPTPPPFRVYGSQIFQMNLVMTAIVVLAVISSLLFVAIQALESTMLRRHGAVGAAS